MEIRKDDEADRRPAPLSGEEDVEALASLPQSPDVLDPAADGSLDKDTVKKRVFSASGWSIIANFGAQTATFLIFLILARLLEPSDFGIVALATSFLDLTRSVMLGGIPEALIQRKTWDDVVANTAFWMNMIGGLLFTSGAIVIALTLWSLGEHSQTWVVLAALSSTLLIDALRSVHEARLRRDFDYKKLAARSIIAALLGGVIGVIMAFAGLGVWALVGQRVITALSQTAIIWTATRYRPRLQVDRASIRPLLSFSFDVLAGRFLGQVNRRLADIVLGTLAGTHILGLYRVGTRSLDYIVSATVTPLQGATLSAFSRLEGTQTSARAYVRFTQFTAITTIPAFLGTAAIAPDFIVVMFGPKWLDGAWPMILLSFAVIPTTFVYFFQPAMQAKGRPRAAVGPEIFRLFVGAVCLLLLAPYGLIWASLGEVLRRYLVTPHIFYVLRKELGLTTANLMESIFVPMLWSLAMFASILALRETVLADIGPAIRMGISIAVGGLIYGCGLLLFSRRFVRDVYSSISPGLPPAFKRIANVLIR